MVDATQLCLSCHCTHGGCYVTLFVLSLHTWWMLRNLVSRQEGHSQDSKVTLSRWICHIPKVSCRMSMHGCGVVTACKACTKAWVTCVATCDATKFRAGDLGKMEQKCSKSRDNWLWSVTLTGNSGHHIYISKRMNCKTHGFLANPANRTVETSSKTHGLLRAPSPSFSPLPGVVVPLSNGLSGLWMRVTNYLP